MTLPFATALVIVDPQKAFVDPRGSLARAHGLDEIRPNLRTLEHLFDTIARARRHQVPITFVRSEYSPGQFSGGALDAPLGDVCVPGKGVDCEWADGLEIFPTDTIVTKTTADAFASEQSDEHLRSLVARGTRVLYFAGFQLTTCVRATALSSSAAFRSAGIRSVVLTSASGARASSYIASRDGGSRVELVLAELIAAGVEVLPDAPFTLVDSVPHSD